MGRFREKLDLLLEYAGISSRHYYHSARQVAYDPDQPLGYFIDQTRRADYAGPFDADRLPLYVHQGQTDHLPVLTCFYGLGHLELHRRTGREENLVSFLKVARWLVDHQRPDGLWLTPFAMPRFGMKAPYPSAMVQGLGISCLTRAALVTGDTRFTESAVLALKPYQRDVRDGGVAGHDGGQVFYEEYPAIPYHHVLNGFIYAMWGLHDLAQLASDSDAARLFDEGLQTLIDWLPRFDIGYWSLYHLAAGSRNPATVHYHHLHVAQLEVMYALTGQELFREYASRWQEYGRHSLNSLRTLPSKMWWRWTYRPTRVANDAT